MTLESGINVDKAVRDRYSEAAKAQEPALCCPVEYNTEYLKIIPSEVIERDYGCGDPSVYVKEGETVLDLGSGGGKICLIASQVVGKSGRVIGVDMNDDMLDLAHRATKEVAEKLGYNNVEYRKGNIQDLKLDRAQVENYLKENPVKNNQDLIKLEQTMDELRRKSPMIPDNSVDVVVSNCVLNLVASDEKEQLMAEIFRVLKKGGRAVISDIVSDEFVPQHLQDNEELWSGCISGAFQEHDFLKAFERSGFYGIEQVKRDEKPWQTVEGIEFRSVTVVAYKGKEGVCMEHNQAVTYNGPFSSVQDDDGHVFTRGARTAVCAKTFEILQKEPYASYFSAIEPLEAVDPKTAREFSCSEPEVFRDPKQTKGQDYKETKSSEGSCC